MNTANIKSYAPKARRDFIQAVTEKAHLLGLSENHIEPVEIKGDVAIIAGRPYPKEIGTIRQDLENRIRQDGFELTMRKMAYTWFNRFVAIRYMELHDYLDHGYRVLSNRTGSEIPELLDHATNVDFPGLNKEEVVRLRLAGDKDNELFQLLIVAQCNALSRAMPFLFEKIGGYAELLMPDNLLHSNSPVRNLVNDISEEDWQQIEIIGWIYQFYISEKKNEVIGKMVKSEDIPAATQLFTPNWIVKYMVQNSLGAQWLATYPHSQLIGQMEYYIEPAEQTDEGKAQLAAITPSTLNPEELTLIDPACGSGHILVEAYDLFKTIYLERGYRQRDVAQLILEKNLFGLDIDGRAAQLTGFALMMKGRGDDRQFFERGVKINVMALVDSTSFDPERLAKTVELANYGIESSDLRELERLFEHATTFGSLIQVPRGLAEKLPALKQLSEVASQNLFLSDAPKQLGRLIQQAELLAAQYDAVVANPPYMGVKWMSQAIKEYVTKNYSETKFDLFACFIERAYSLAKNFGRCSMITAQSWMFLSSFARMRERMLSEKTLMSLTRIGFNTFPSLNSKIAQGAVFSLTNHRFDDFVGVFIELNRAGQSEDKNLVFLQKDSANRFELATDVLRNIPASPIAFWLTTKTISAFERFKPIYECSISEGQNITANNDKYLKLHWEVQRSKVESAGRWSLYAKGGPFRKWYGNLYYVIDWSDSARSYYRSHSSARIIPEYLRFREGVTWSLITSSAQSFRLLPSQATFDKGGSSVFFDKSEDLELCLLFLNSAVARHLMKALNPSVSLQVDDVRRLPFSPAVFLASEIQCSSLIQLSSADWHSYEHSWDFQSFPFLTTSPESNITLESSYTAWVARCRGTIAEMQRLEQENNRLFIDAYGLEDELTSDVPIEQLTLTVNPAYRYGGKLTEEVLWTRFRQDTMKELVSYAIGCMMGRYSLFEPGLIYAHSGNQGFDPSHYTTFSADDDGILPLTDTEWFDDDTAHRLIKFISVAWDAAHLEENLTFLADNLLPKKNESSRDTIRRYLCDNFFKDHLQTYKKRPIYWLLSSGKQKAFQCLIYLHRYNESTLSRVRSAYVTPLFGNFNARLEYLQNEWDAADSASAKKKFQKEIDDMKKKLAELSTFDDELRHYADKRISLDLDDGVKVNYGKFGNLLAEKKTVTG